MTAATMPMLIQIPVHEEEGWTTKSPETEVAPVKARLEASKNRELKLSADDLKKSAERAAALRSAHLDAVQQRAARDNQRVAEGVARRLRLAAAAKQRLEARMEAVDKRAEVQKEERERKRDELARKRSDLSLAVKEAREARNQAILLRHDMTTLKKAEAERARQKHLQCIVNKSAFQVKHALAVAAALKEKERAQAMRSGEALAAKLEAADMRRRVLEKSPSTETRSRAVASTLNEHAIHLLVKRRSLDEALEKAASKREAHISSIVERAGASNERARETVQAIKEKAAAAERASERGLYEKLNAADVTRMQKQRRASRSLPHMVASSLIVVDVHTPGAVAPAGLVERLLTKPKLLLSTATARQTRAACRRSFVTSMRAIEAARRTSNASLARGRREAWLEVKRAVYEARATAASVRAAGALAARKDKAAKMNERVATAKDLREAAAAVAAAVGSLKEKKMEEAKERREAVARSRGKGGIFANRGILAALNRKRAAAAAQLKLSKADTRRAAADVRRASIISKRVTTARLSYLGRGVAVKIVKKADANGEVDLEIVAPATPTKAEETVDVA